MAALFVCSLPTFAAAPAIPFTVTMAEAVNVTGSPRIVLNVDGNTRYAVYSAGTGTASLTFTYTATAGDVDLNGIDITSTSLDLNGGSVTDINGNIISNLTFTPPANMSTVHVNYPSLSLDFVTDADGRYSLSGAIYNDLASFLTAAGGTFSRASTATYFDSTGTMQIAASGAPRLTYDPSTLAAEGLFIEPSRTNIQTDSSNFTIGWNPGGATVSNNAAVAPDGSNSAALITMGNNSVINFTSGYSAINGTSYVQSVFLKSLTLANGSFNLYVGKSDSTCGRSASLSNAGGAISATDGTSSVQSLPNGWYRLIMPYTASCSFSGGSITTSGGAVFVNGSTFLIWGRMVEAGSFATSYIPTSGSTVTRAADNFSIPTGAWFNLNASTLYIHAEAADGLPTAGSFMTGIGTNSNDYLGFPYASAGTFNSSSYYRSGGAGPIISASGALSLNTIFRAAYTYSTSSGIASYVKNGNSAATASGVTLMGSASYLSLGYAPFTTTPMTSHFLGLKYYPTRASDAQIQLMTTP